MELSPQQDVYYIDIVSPIDYFIDTVTPSAIQLNKEKTMSIELDGPLYLGSNSLQQQVDQNTEDITELQSDVSSIEGDIGSLDNLATSDKSSLVNAINETLSVLDPTQTADYIKNSKGLESGEISTNASILPWVEEMSHSTFDRSKFTVVGSPNITDDGIASGFSSSNYLTISPLPSLVGSANSWELNMKFITPDDITSRVGQLFEGNAAWCNQLRVFGDGSNYTGIQVCLTSTGNSYDIANYKQIVSVTANTTYWLKLIFTGTEYLCKYSTDGTNFTTVNIATSSLKIADNSTNLLLGINRSYADISKFRGSIDLKQFSITVDGVEVFSGNRTGIDTIKPDNYTVVGTPTITSDGIASGFSSSNYLTIPQFDVTKPFSVKIPFVFNTSAINWKDLFSIGSTYIDIGSNNNARMSLQLSTSGLKLANKFIYSFVVGSSYYIIFGWDGNTYTAKIYNENDVLIDTVSYTSSETIVNGTTQIGYKWNAWTGSVDLNSFKIYVDGDLVYQPCLKIPYTESKTGSKVVDSIYRYRVNDMADQFGYANYYTLSDTDFTLPQVELYGLIGQRTLRDSYRNGINYWELYSNRDLEQGGSCTSGVEVTFARPFADTNYVLSVPYSAKSATAFTPTQTGDWIAKGKGLL